MVPDLQRLSAFFKQFYLEKAIGVAKLLLTNGHTMARVSVAVQSEHTEL